MALVFSNVNGHALAIAHHILHERRGIDKAEHAGTEDQPPHHIVMLLGIRVEGNIADTLAGDGKVFGMRGADQAVPVEH